MKKLSILIFFSSALFTGCWPFNNPHPFGIRLFGEYAWERTINSKTGQLIESVNHNNTKTLKFIQGNETDPYHYKIIFYTNGIPTDSLFRESWEGGGYLNKKRSQLVKKYIDKEGDPVTVFYHYHFEKGKDHPWAFDLNIQRNTSVYNSAKDTTRMFYRSLN